MAENIILIDLDEDEDSTMKSEEKTNVCETFNCIECNCNYVVNMITSPSFASAFNGINDEKRRKRMTCQQCHKLSMKDQKADVDALKSGQPEYNSKFSNCIMEIILSDSDQDTEEKKETPKSEKNMKQNKESIKLKNKLETLCDNSFATCKEEVEIINEIIIINEKNDDLNNNPEVLEIDKIDKSNVTTNIPPPGRLIKEFPDVNTIVYINNHYSLTPWVKSKVMSIESTSPFECSVKLLPERYKGNIKTVSGKLLAIAKPCSIEIPIGTRVIAIFRDVHSKNYYGGIIAESPKSWNKYRYLIFFDDGYAQYVEHKNIYVVCESSPRVYDDMRKESQSFIKTYLESYPARPMLRLQSGQIIITEWKGKWLSARVAKVDVSLVKIHFYTINRIEWIYRGSTRLLPVYKQRKKANERHSHRPIRTLRSAKNNQPYVEYTQIDVNKQKEQPQQRTRSFATKSTRTNKTLRTKYISNPVENIQNKEVVLHNKCSPKCLEGTSCTPDKIKEIGPLLIPLLCDWDRHLQTLPTGNKTAFYYAPCGVLLDNMEELHDYLRITGSEMSLDMFDFSSWVNCYSELTLDKCFVSIKDLSYGVEKMPISCVNDIDHTVPDKFVYTVKREPTEGVNINTDTEFLCSCDCEDDCQDKDKCQCWQLTIQAATSGKVKHSNIGYVHKRLPNRVLTGIYECNSKCKCAVKTCLNRVVQHPLSLKLQVFKTSGKGWGIRCLNDIPAGSFICMYAGKLLTDTVANEYGLNNGDEYFADLDFIELAERFKDNYESYVMEPEDNEEQSNDLKNNSNNGYNSKNNRQSNEVNECVDDNSIDSDNDDTKQREPSRFDPVVEPDVNELEDKSTRYLFGQNESVYIVDAKTNGNIGRFINHSCNPNVFSQNVFVDTHDLRFPWVAFFTADYVRAGQELTWDYSYDPGSVPGKIIICRCKSSNCRGRLL